MVESNDENTERDWEDNPSVEVESVVSDSINTETAEEQPVTEEAFILAEKLRSSDSYYQIRCSLYRH